MNSMSGVTFHMPLFFRQHLLQSIVGLVLLLALTAGAVATTVSVSHKPVSKPVPAVLHLANEGTSDLITLDPARGLDLNSRQAAQLIFGGLVRFGPNFSVMPDAAASWDVSADGMQYVFHLRSNVRFGNGALLTASDAAFSLNRTLSKRFAKHSGATLLSDIQGAQQVIQGITQEASGITATDAHTLQIRLSHPSGSFLAKLATPAGYLVPPTMVRAKPKDWFRHAVGTGPFMVSHWVRNTGLLLVANPYYWAGKLKAGGVDMPFIPEPIAAYKMYRAGALDAMGTVKFPAEVLYDVQGTPDFHPSPRLETIYLMLNLRLPPFNSMLVRQAFAHAIDKEALVQTVYSNFAQATNGMVPPGMPGYDASVPGAEYNPLIARRLLNRAGYPGGRHFPHVLFKLDQDAQNTGLASALSSQWKRVLGVQVDFVQYSHPSYLDLLTLNAFQIAVIDWTADYPDPENFLTQLLHTGSVNNNGAWSDRTFDMLTDQANTMRLTDPHRIALYRRAQAIAIKQAAVIPLVNPKRAILLKPSVHGLEISGDQLLARQWTNVTVNQKTPP